MLEKQKQQILTAAPCPNLKVKKYKPEMFSQSVAVCWVFSLLSLY